MVLKDYFHVIRKRFKLILVITLVVTITTALISYFWIKPIYEADIWIVIGSSNKASSSSSQNYNDVLMYQKMVKTYGKLVKSRIVAEDVIEKLKLKSMDTSTLISMITVTPDNDTQFLTITVSSSNPAQAMEVANQYAKSLKEVSLTVNKIDIVELIDEAQLPKKPHSPNPVRNTSLAFFLSLMLSTGLVFILEFMDNTVKTKEDVEKACKLPVIGTISLVTKENKDVMIW